MPAPTMPLNDRKAEPVKPISRLSAGCRPPAAPSVGPIRGLGSAALGLFLFAARGGVDLA